MSSRYGECHDTAQAGRCGSKECRLFQSGGCEVGAEVIEAEQDSMPREEYEEYCIMYKIQLEKPMNTSNQVSGRVETKGLFRTAYDIGDTFWAMLSSEPRELAITKVSINVKSDNIEVSYYLETGSHGLWKNDTQLASLASSKEELMKQVFNL